MGPVAPAGWAVGRPHGETSRTQCPCFCPAMASVWKQGLCWRGRSAWHAGKRPQGTVGWEIPGQAHTQGNCLSGPANSCPSLKSNPGVVGTLMTLHMSQGVGTTSTSKTETAKPQTSPRVAALKPPICRQLPH